MIVGRSLSKEDKATLSQLLESGGTVDDRLRLLLVLLLLPDGQGVPKEETERAEVALQVRANPLRPRLSVLLAMQVELLS